MGLSQAVDHVIVALPSSKGVYTGCDDLVSGTLFYTCEVLKH
jgi:hypothetical protein